MNRTVLWYCLIFAAVATCQSPGIHSAFAQPPHAELLPRNTTFYLSTPSVDELRTRGSRTEMGKAWQTPGLSDIANDTYTLIVRAIGDRLGGAEIAELLASTKGAATVAIVPGPGELPVYTLMIDKRGQAGDLAGWISQTRERAQRNGWTVSESGESGRRLVAFQHAGKPPREFCLLDRAETLCLASSITVGAQWQPMALPKDQQLLHWEPFHRNLNACQLDEPISVYLYAVPVELAQQMQQDPDDGIDPKVILTKHGFDGIRAVAGKAVLGAPNLDLTFQLKVDAPQPYQKSMRMFRFVAQPKRQAPPWVPAYVNSCLSMEWEIETLLEHISGPADELLGKGAEGTFQQILDDLKAEGGPQVDLEKDLFAFLGPEILMLSEHVMPIDLASERTILCIRTKDEAKVAGAIRALLKSEPSAQALTVRNQPHDLWKLGVSSKSKSSSKGKSKSKAKSKSAEVTKSGQAFKTPGVMVADGYLMLATNVDAIRRLLASSEEPKLIAATDYRQMINSFTTEKPPETFAQLFVRLDRDIETTYELLKSGRIDGAESAYAQALNRILVPAKKRGVTLPAFEKLPPFEDVSRHLGMAVTHGHVSADGWMFHGIVIPKSTK